MNSDLQGYYRFPTVYKDKIVFVSENDLWEVPSEGGTARRLTSNLGAAGSPRYSEDGRFIAFTGSEEGVMEAYVMPSAGGSLKRLTWFGSNTTVVGWRNGNVLVASDYGQPFLGQTEIFEINPETLEINRLPYGTALNISYGDKGIVIGRNTGDSARWKRYKGGRSGRLWVDVDGKGKFNLIESIKGNISAPMWIGERIYFISDETGVGNLFSCQPNGEEIKQHTSHEDFYTRSASTDNTTIVYQCGADIYSYDIASEKSDKVEIQYASPQTQLVAKFTPSQKYLDCYTINSDGSKLGVISRGKIFVFGNWEGPVKQLGVKQGVRYRLIDWFAEEQKFAVVSDEGGEDHIEIYDVNSFEPKKVLNGLEIGRPMDLKVAPRGDMIAISNHKHEIRIIDVNKDEVILVDQSKCGMLGGFNWSPDGRWLAYSTHVNPQQRLIRIYDLQEKKYHDVTDPIIADNFPVFDPEGRYLYFLSGRVFNPVRDNLHFDYNFPLGEKPYLITLQKDLENPFIPKPKGFGMQQEENNAKNESDKDSEQDCENNKPCEVKIDFEGIKNRVLAFPVAEGLYTQIEATPDKVFFTKYPMEGTLNRTWADPTPQAKSTIKVYDLGKLEESVFAAGVTNFWISANHAALVYQKGFQLRVTDAARDPKVELPKETTPNRKTGWIDFNRIKLEVVPREEWKQMFSEAWRLQRDYFWVADMSGIDWKAVHDRYLPLVDRAGTRNEFSDLMWEMQGELGTSHAYELGGDYKPAPTHRIGFLGAQLEWDSQVKGYKVVDLANGDVWHDKLVPPLKSPGVNIDQGVIILKINDEQLSPENPPYKVLSNLSGAEIVMDVIDPGAKEFRTVTVKTLPVETPLWYRNWVEANRRYVHEQSGGKIGYVHVPNMGPIGYAEFHRYYLTEFDYDGLIIDVRFNGGGHVSPLLLEKLSRKRVGYTLTRWMGQWPKPQESPRGPMAALTNEYAGSDGDIFSHGFKLMKLGKLIGTRTWGGVVGIWPRNSLVDGTLTTQPEFSNWFVDVGFSVENYGTDPDIEVHIAPHDFVKGVDPQIDTAIKTVMEEIETNPPQVPDLSKAEKPNLSV